MEAHLATQGVSDVPPDVTKLITCCLDRDPHKRPTFSELVRLTTKGTSFATSFEPSPPGGQLTLPQASLGIAQLQFDEIV